MSAEARSEAAPGLATPLVYAGLWSRGGAMAIDLVVFLLWSGAFEALYGAVLPDPAVLGPITASSLVALLGFWAYLVVATGTTGGTLGKHALGLRVVTTAFERPDWETVLFREVVGRIIVTGTGGVGYLWAAIDGRKQGWHDKVADTLLVRRVEVAASEDPWEETTTRSG